MLKKTLYPLLLSTVAAFTQIPPTLAQYQQPFAGMPPGNSQPSSNQRSYQQSFAGMPTAGSPPSSDQHSYQQSFAGMPTAGSPPSSNQHSYQQPFAGMPLAGSQPSSNQQPYRQPFASMPPARHIPIDFWSDNPGSNEASPLQQMEAAQNYSGETRVPDPADYYGYNQYGTYALPPTGTGSVSLNVVDDKQLELLRRYSYKPQISAPPPPPDWVRQYLKDGHGVYRWESLTPAQRSSLGF